MVNRTEKYNGPSYEFSIAPDRPYVPREGFYPKAKWQQSVAPHPNLYLPTLEPLPFEEAKKDLHELWTTIVNSRFGEMGHNDWGDLLRYYYHLDEVAFGINTENLFKSFIVPAIKKHCGESNKNQIATDNISYLLPLWNKKELLPFQLVEGELSRLIKEGGKLPDNIGAVFLDFPPNQQKKDFQFDVDQLIKFINNHPDVLFIIDQANLYFSEDRNSSIGNDLMFSDIYYKDYDSGKIRTHQKRLRDNNLCIVTNTTTKAVGLSGCAVAAGTKRAKELLGQESGHPAYFFNDESSINQARLSLLVESGKPGEPVASQEGFGRFHPAPSNKKDYDAITADEFREKTIENKEKLESHLKELFGDSVTCPELVVEGARIMINAKDLGFKKGQKLCDVLSVDPFSIATKPATVYASPKKEKEWARYVQMTIPWKEEMLNADLEAFNKLYQIHKTRVRFAKVMKRLISV